jgi:hypothetical protein
MVKSKPKPRPRPAMPTGGGNVVTRPPKKGRK